MHRYRRNSHLNEANTRGTIREYITPLGGVRLSLKLDIARVSVDNSNDVWVADCDFRCGRGVSNKRGMMQVYGVSTRL